MANEYTLADYERLAKTNLAKAVIRTWRMASPLMDSLSFKVVPALSVEYLRVNSVPSVPWRAIGDDFTQAKVDPEPIKERPFFIGAKIDIPKEIVKATNTVVDQRQIQEEAISKGIAFGFNWAFLRNTPTLDSKALTGLWYRLVNDLGSDQTVAGGGVDVSPDTADAAAGSKLIRLIDDLLSRFDDLSGVHLVMNRQAKLALEFHIKDSGLLDSTQDQLGRTFSTYGKGGPKIIDAGYKYDLTTQILINTELDDGSAMTGGDATSIYAYKVGEGYMNGFCEFDISVDDVGLLESRVAYRTVIDWAPGIFIVHPRSVARLVGVVAA